MDPDPVVLATGAVAVGFATAVTCAPFLRTATGRRVFGTLAALPVEGTSPTKSVSQTRVAAVYSVAVVGYAAAIIAVALVGVQTVGAGGIRTSDLALLLLFPYSLAVAAVGTVLPLRGTEWRRGLDRTRATVTWAAFVAVVTGCVVVGGVVALTLAGLSLG